MRINLKNQFNNDTIHAVIRMKRAEYLALREYMHTAAGKDIEFPHKVHIVKHGYGWYFMAATNEHRAVEKMQFALKVIRAFQREEEAKTDEELKMWAPTMIAEGTHIASFSNAHSAVGEFGYLGVPQQHTKPQQQKAPASSDALARLAARFSKNKERRV